MIKKHMGIPVLIFLCMSILLWAQRPPRVASVHNLFSDDLGIREDIFYDTFGFGGAWFGHPVYSPNGDKVAFSLGHSSQLPNEEGENMICIVNADGTGLHIVSNQKDMRPTWSPDGAQIAFSSERNGSLDFQIFKMNVDGTSQIQLTTSGGNNPAWSPDGTKIAFGKAGIWVINPDGSGLLQLTNHPKDAAPTWSPDSSKIAFISERNGTDNIWIMNVDGSGLEQITQNGAMVADWSPDGNWIAFNREDQIWLIRPDGTDEVQLHTNFSAGWPDWFPDSSKIVFDGIVDLKFDHDIYVMTLR